MMVKVKDLKWAWRYGFCVYCGVQVQTQRRPSNTEPITCRSHRDLLELDPHHAPLDQWADAR